MKGGEMTCGLKHIMKKQPVTKSFNLRGPSLLRRSQVDGEQGGMNKESNRTRNKQGKTSGQRLRYPHESY